MRKLLLVTTLFIITLLGVQGVLAEEIIEEVIVEPTTFDNWIAIISDFASLKNFIVSAGGLGALVTFVKLRGIYKYFKSAKGIASLEVIGFNILSKLTDKPDIFIKMIAIVVEFPVIKSILDNAKRKVDMYEIEILDKIVALEGKISAQLFNNNPEAKAQANILLQKYRDEYEAIQLNK